MRVERGLVEERVGGAVLDSPVLDLLRKGRERIVAGWCRGSYFDGRNFCAIGAIYHDCFGGYAGVSTAALAERALQNQVHEGRQSVLIYNDHVARGKEDILALYDRAIDAERVRLLGDAR